MTTVVIHDNKVYCDSQATAGSMISDYDVDKAVNLGQCIVVGAGRWSHVVKFQNWVADNVMAEIAQQEHPYAQVQMPEEMVEDDFQGAILYPDGVVVMFEGARDSYECNQPVFLGSGTSFAAGAIAAGADGVQAVMAAIQLDPYSGGDVKVEGFEEAPQPLTKESLSELSKEDILAKLFPEGNDYCENKVVSEETLQEGSLQEALSTLEEEDASQSVTILDVNADTYGELFYRWGDGELVDLELIIGDGDIIPISVYALDDYPLATIRGLMNDLGVEFTLNQGKKNLSKKLVAYLEGCVE